MILLLEGRSHGVLDVLSLLFIPLIPLRVSDLILELSYVPKGPRNPRKSIKIWLTDSLDEVRENILGKTLRNTKNLTS